MNHKKTICTLNDKNICMSEETSAVFMKYHEKTGHRVTCEWAQCTQPTEPARNARMKEALLMRGGGIADMCVWRDTSAGVREGYYGEQAKYQVKRDSYSVKDTTRMIT
ncbi:hypothetical protein CBL_01401 [Carabus blaptoides fortunei]